jgi:hypothetical protein
VSSKILTPPSPLRPASVSSPRNQGGYTLSPGGEGTGGSIFWKMRDIGLPSYSNNLSTWISICKKFVHPIPLLMKTFFLLFIKPVVLGIFTIFFHTGKKLKLKYKHPVATVVPSPFIFWFLFKQNKISYSIFCVLMSL